MAVEIKELVIRAVVVPGENPTQTAPAGNITTEQWQRLVQSAVDEVLKVLERKENR